MVMPGREEEEEEETQKYLFASRVLLFQPRRQDAIFFCLTGSSLVVCGSIDDGDAMGNACGAGAWGRWVLLSARG